MGFTGVWECVKIKIVTLSIAVGSCVFFKRVFIIQRLFRLKSGNDTKQISLVHSTCEEINGGIGLTYKALW